MNVPKLRFKEFNDEWKQINLKETFIYLSTSSLSREQLSDKGILKNLHYGDIHKKYNSIVNENDDITTYVKDLNYINKYEKIKENDLIFADASEDYDGIGKAVEVINVKNDTISGLHTILAREKEKIFAPMFKGYYFNSYIIHNQIRVLANGFKVYGISKDSINKLNVKIPTINEQKKIANTLNLLDKKIELQSKKIEDLKLFKKGLIQKIFSSNNLSEVQIKDLGTIITGTTPSKENKNYWNGGIIAWITPTDINYERDISNSITSLTKEGLKKGRFVPKNSILVTCIASIGKNAVIKVDGSCNQQINAIIPNNKFNSNYIYYLMEYISPYLQSIAGTSATAIVNKETFERIKVKVHNYNDQSRIDKYLSSVETKILLEDKLLNKLIKLKKGLIQSMFV